MNTTESMLGLLNAQDHRNVSTLEKLPLFCPLWCMDHESRQKFWDNKKNIAGKQNDMFGIRIFIRFDDAHLGSSKLSKHRGLVDRDNRYFLETNVKSSYDMWHTRNISYATYDMNSKKLDKFCWRPQPGVLNFWLILHGPYNMNPRLWFKVHGVEIE